jgi:hypothetical protein
MITPRQWPSAAFAGALGDNASGQYVPARAEVHDGMVSLWVAPPTGWVQYFSVPAHEVVVKSAAQRITLVVGGRSYPLLADPGAVGRGIQLGVAGTIAETLDRPRLEMGVDVARGVNVAGAANAFHAGGGPAFIAAAQQSGARSSRVGYGPILAIGCGAGLLIVIAVTAVTVFLLGS